MTGTYTFSASITATENVVVTGTVDGVDLSELKDEAVYLDGSHDITGKGQDWSHRGFSDTKT